MIFCFVALGISLLIAMASLRFTRGKAAPIREAADLNSRIVPVDLPAFQNLVDPAEKRFLQAKLPVREFRRIHRKRVLAAIGYVRRTGRNARVLLTLGERGRRSANPEVVQAAQKLSDRALRLRVYSLLATCKLLCEFVFPDAEFAVTALTERYETVLNLGKGVVAMHQVPQHPPANVL